MRTFRELDFRHATTWLLTQGIQEGIDASVGLPCTGLVEVDEPYMGGKKKDKHGAKGLKAGRGIAGEIGAGP